MSEKCVEMIVAEQSSLRYQQLDIANHEANELRARIAELEAAQKWIPVGERLPDFETLDLGDEFLVKLEFPHEIVTTPASYIKGEWYCGTTKYTRRVIAWQPMPERIRL